MKINYSSLINDINKDRDTYVNIISANADLEAAARKYIMQAGSSLSDKLIMLADINDANDNLERLLQQAYTRRMALKAIIRKEVDSIKEQKNK